VLGGNYRTHWTEADRLTELIDRDAQHASCGTLSGGLAANPDPASHGLPAEYTMPLDATAVESNVVLYAIAQLDKPYVFGAAGPEGFDCSGLTMAAWQLAGVSLPHSAAAQASAGTPTTESDLVPGDLVFVPGDDGTLAYPGHVGIYIGSGLVLNAADEQVGIRVQTYANFIAVGHGLAALRHLL
jgi:cell wall-associated NlpC family hydrolase